MRLTICCHNLGKYINCLIVIKMAIIKIVINNSNKIHIIMWIRSMHLIWTISRPLLSSIITCRIFYSGCIPIRNWNSCYMSYLCQWFRSPMAWRISKTITISMELTHQIRRWQIYLARTLSYKRWHRLTSSFRARTHNTWRASTKYS